MKKTYDAILLLGYALDKEDAPTQELCLRAQAAAKAYKDGLAPVIVACGGCTAGHVVSEAQVMARLLMDAGVPEDVIVLEDKSQVTMENLRYAKEKLDGARGRRVLVVTSDYHVRRSVLTARRVGFAAKGLGAALEHDESWRRKKNEEWGYTVDLLMGWQDEGRSRPDWTYKLFDLVFARKGR